MRHRQKNSSRRQFLTVAAGASAALLLGPDRLRAAEVDPRIARILSSTITVDMHSHVRPRYVKDPAEARPDPDIDLAGQIRRSGFAAVCQTYDVDTTGKQEAGVYPGFNRIALDFEDRLLNRNHMRRALTLKDLQAAHAQHQPIIVQCAEGAQFLEGRLERIAEVYKRGLRGLQIIHDQDDPVSPLGDFYTARAPQFGGLTPFGAEVIKACNRMGILVDLAHGTVDSVRGALKVATEPMLVSHTSIARDTDTADTRRRAIGNDLAREVAGAGGVVGVWWRGTDTLKEYVAAIRAMVDTLDADHVGIGTDSDITSSNILPYTNQIWADQNGGFFHAVAGEMLRQGFTPVDIGKIGGGNFCRVFDKVTAGHA
jgi:membrane dipeptidase